MRQPLLQSTGSIITAAIRSGCVRNRLSRIPRSFHGATSTFSTTLGTWPKEPGMTFGVSRGPSPSRGW